MRDAAAAPSTPAATTDVPASVVGADEPAGTEAQQPLKQPPLSPSRREIDESAVQIKLDPNARNLSGDTI